MTLRKLAERLNAIVAECDNRGDGRADREVKFELSSFTKAGKPRRVSKYYEIKYASSTLVNTSDIAEGFISIMGYDASNRDKLASQDKA